MTTKSQDKRQYYVNRIIKTFNDSYKLGLNLNIDALLGEIMRVSRVSLRTAKEYLKEAELHITNSNNDNKSSIQNTLS